MMTRPLDQLSPESRAVLSLVLLQSRSYSDIADLLRLGQNEVRNRAHIAAEHLIEPAEDLEPQTRARVIDYMLGEQTVSERAATRAELARSEPARRWATELAAALAPLAKTPLPAIPGDTPEPPPAVVDPAPLEPAPRPEAPRFPAPTPARRVATNTSIAAPSPARPRERRRPRVPPMPFVIGGLVAVVVIVVLIIVLSGSSTARPSGSTGHPGQPLRKLVLAPAGSDRNALGAGDVIRQKGGGLLLLLQAHGLAANSHGDSYAVWLFNAPGDARLLGFVSPGVGAAGTFSSGVTAARRRVPFPRAGRDARANPSADRARPRRAACAAVARLVAPGGAWQKVALPSRCRADRFHRPPRRPPRRGAGMRRGCRQRNAASS